MTGLVEVDECDGDGGDDDDNEVDYGCLALEVELEDEL